MTKFSVPLHEEVSAPNRIIFDNLKKTAGFVPNIYALMAYSDTALDAYVKFENAPTSLSKKETELVKLVVSQENGCKYCLSAHTVLGKLNGFSEEQMLQIRSGAAPFDTRLDTLAHVTQQITANKGGITEEALQNFFNAGYTKGTLVELVQTVAIMMVTNYLYRITKIPIDFPLAPALEQQAA